MAGPTGDVGMSQWGPLAPWGQRAVAYLITIGLVIGIYIVMAIIGAVLGAIADFLGVIWFLLTWLVSIGIGLYVYYLDGTTGGHPGKRLLGLKTVNANTGELIGGGLGIVRGIAHFVDQIICYIGYLFPLWDPKRQTLADKIMTTVVLTDQPKKEFGPDLFLP
jgi:uncharacterized RDD family membrane protein YckC